MRYGSMQWGSGFWMFAGFLLMIGLVVLIVWAVMRIAGARDQPGAGQGIARDASRPAPNEILRERFARGEITEQEFEQAKKVLGPDR